MSHNFLAIKEGAFFISDSHESENKRRNFGKFLDAILSEKLKPAALFLMGDMYDILIGLDKYSEKLWANQIEKLDTIAQKIEVYYFEGNHDFNLQKLFRNVKVVPISSQPLLFETPKGVLALSHGDKYCGIFYKIYTAVFRCKITLFLLSMYEKFTNYRFTKKMTKKLENKKICRKIENFENIIASKIDNYKDCKYVAEGHYHQNKTFTCKDKIYINFGSFACENVYYIFTCKEGLEFQQKVFNP
ncbi:MAG: UDP-2,3-diacylglucosamine diphosphatase [Campylobacteraceae bacterium]